MRSVLLFLGLTFAVTLPCQAQDAKPNTLTPKEIADGWILLFDGETTFGWSGSPKMLDGTLQLTRPGDKMQSSCQFEKFELRFEFKDVSKKDLSGVGLIVPSEGTSVVDHLPQKDGWTLGSMTFDGRRVRCNVDGEKNSGIFGGVCAVLFQDVIKLRNLKLKPVNTKPLFNGKDLTGWKVFPGDKYKSKFTVDKGEINVQNGPGDLQTTGKYQNFILQLECISHGKFLNSGIFFRCRDNEYQNGYEAQIRNQFTAEATQTYVIEEYDPKTNKLLEKKKIVSTAVDYGTGAIYRRQPARKEMSKDGEWFTMTIIANGNHLATWVNGVQVTDWTDNRPKSDNARTGCRLEAGHISIQGHDPTTNLSFRNLRIAELPASK